MSTISESSTMTTIIMVQHEEGTVQVGTLYGSLDSAMGSINIAINITNKDLAVTYATEVKAQYDQFYTAVQSRGIDLGFTIF